MVLLSLPPTCRQLGHAPVPKRQSSAQGPRLLPPPLLMGCQPPSHGLLQQRKPPEFMWLWLEAEQWRGDARLPPSVVLAMMRRASPLTYPYILRTRQALGRDAFGRSLIWWL
eukprot:s6958_g3.t1